ncbi:VacJ family lipoprotein [Novosphingobium flavum]|uniref:VacJ family lipoprotein n=1 Tax=Novosphingobium flavum TaxID=1778672 RepID=A0A7X1KN60_9SPHN|nr:VacJ family lipoprotein [Novosphingobium flavum]MBC2667020.1 VacJ family lipoprotein [Novosphingobium flavum]
MEVPPAADDAAALAPEGDIVISARRANPGDPAVKVNEASFQAIEAVDKAFVGPVAKVYEKGVPKPVRSGLRNFLRNLEQPVIALNFLLQLKPVSAVKAVARFGINSTIGVAGVLDVAKRKPFNLPYRPNGFANTLACYGVGPGPFLFLPLVGPTTLRDVFGLVLDKSALPVAVGAPFNKKEYALPSNVISALNRRVEMDGQISKLREESNPYAATRELYLQQRKAEISAICPKKGDPPPDPDLPPRPGKGVD